MIAILSIFFSFFFSGGWVVGGGIYDMLFHAPSKVGDILSKSGVFGLGHQLSFKNPKIVFCHFVISTNKAP